MYLSSRSQSCFCYILRVKLVLFFVCLFSLALSPNLSVPEEGSTTYLLLCWYGISLTLISRASIPQWQYWFLCRCTGGRTFTLRCPMRLAFQPTQNVCEWASKVDCRRGYRPSLPPVTTKPVPTTAGKLIMTTARSEPLAYGKLVFQSNYFFLMKIKGFSKANTYTSQFVNIWLNLYVFKTSRNWITK